MHCPECDGISYSRKTKTPEWRCRKCGHEWDMGPALNTSSSTIPVPRRPGVDDICQWEPQFVDSSLRCRRRIDSGHPNLCILHLPDPNKSSELFYRALGEKFVQDESNPQVREINLAGVAFLSLRNLSAAFGLQETRKRAVPVGRLFDEKPVTKRVTFAEAIFLTDPDERPRWMVCGRLSFHGMVSFQHARFENNINFGDARFHLGANFDDARFGASALFGFLEHDSDIFTLTKHRHPSPFTNNQKPSIFGGKTSFRRVQFEGNATFYGCQFNEVDFSESRFSESADFMGAAFKGRAIFKHANFEENVRFGRGNVELFGPDSLFVGDADFSHVKFHGAAEFSGDIAYEGVKRVGSTAYHLLSNLQWRWSDYRPGPFEGNADFMNAQFGRAAVFPGAHFAKRANFSNAKFPEEGFPGADFREVKFSGDAVFLGAEFGAIASFSAAKFGGAAVFRGAKFPEEMYRQPENIHEVDSSPFRKVQFNKTPDFGDYQLDKGHLRLETTPRNTRNQ